MGMHLKISPAIQTHALEAEMSKSIRYPSRQQVAGFSLFRSPAEGLPRQTAKILGAPKYGLNWKLAQRLASPVPGKFWAVPGRDHICVFGQSSQDAISAVCSKMSVALATGVATVQIQRQAGRYLRLMVGVAPDGVKEAVVYTAGQPKKLRVTHNVFTLQDSAGDPPEKVVLH
jgi:hypothetical protein